VRSEDHAELMYLIIENYFSFWQRADRFRFKSNRTFLATDFAERPVAPSGAREYFQDPAKRA
jgi:hypothetical protein